VVAVQGFGRPVVQKDYNMNENFLSGSSAKSFTPDHQGYEFEPEEPARWEYLRKNLLLINRL